MSLLGLFNRKGKHTAMKANSFEKKQFLSNDFIERMIRVEQKVFESLGEKKTYNQTKYYQDLTNDEKISFNNFLKNKHSKKTIFFGVLSLILGLFFLFNFNVTGNVINENIGLENSILFSVILSGLVIVGILSFTISSISERLKERRFQSHFQPLERIYSKRGLRKYFG